MKHSGNLINKIASDEVLEEAFRWLCKRRKDYSHNNDVWDLRFRWTEEKTSIQNQLLEGSYVFGPLTEIRLPGETIELWSSRDSLVLKAIAIVLGEYLQPVMSGDCYHLKGRGGAKAAVRMASRNLRAGSFVMKSDVRSYYASIDHDVLAGIIEQYVPDEMVIALILQYIKRTVYSGGLFRNINIGISLGCPLSPLIGYLYLKPLDDLMKKEGCFYARFMDDWLIIVPSRWKLRGVVSSVNQVLNTLKIQKHPEKTFIGKAVKGFDFLGYHIRPGYLTLAISTIDNFAKHIKRLYEQNTGETRIAEYVTRWFRWALTLCSFFFLLRFQLVVSFY